MQPLEQRAVYGGAHQVLIPLFVSTPAKSVKELDAKIAKLQSTLSTLQSTAMQLKGAFFWRSITVQAVATLNQKVQVFCEKLMHIQNELYDSHGGIHRDLAFFAEKQSVFTRLDKIQALERTFLFLQTTASILTVMKDNNFLDAYTSIKDEHDKAVVAGSEADNNKFKESFYSVIHQHFAQPDNQAISEELATKTKVHLKTFASADSEFFFWKNTDMSTWTKSWLPRTYEETSPLARKLEEKVGLRISGLRQAIHDMIEQIYQGDDTQLSSMLELYGASIAKLQLKTSTLCEKIHNTPLDGLTEPLLNYANGLKMTLVELNRLKALAIRMSKSINIFKAQSKLRTFLLLPILSPIAALDAGESIRAGSLITTEEYQQDLINHALASTAATTQQIFRNCICDTITLTQDEQSVWEHLISLQPYEELYSEGEQRVEDGPVAKPTVPQRIQSFFIKRACRALYFPSKDGIDSELELFLHVIKTHIAYHTMYDHSINNLLRTKSIHDIEQYDQWRAIVGNGDFHHAVVSYDEVYKNGRNEQLLTRAVQTMSLILELAKYPRDIFSYAQIYQRCVEFSVLDVGDTHKAQHQIFSKLLFSKLQIAAASAKYILTQESHRTQSLHSWEQVIDSVLNECTESGQHENTIKPLLEGFILHTLSCSLYAEYPQEKRTATAAIERILKSESFIPYLSVLSDDAKELLYEYIFNKIIKSNDDAVTDFEHNLVAEGPIKTFINTHEEHFSLSKTQQALYILCLHEQTQQKEQRYFTNLFVSTKGQAAFERWQKKFRAFLTSSLDHHTLWEEITSSADIDPINSLKPYLGELEAQKWSEAMKRSVVFTDAFVKK